VVRDALDLDGQGPGTGLLRAPPASSPVAQERVEPGRPGAGFAAGTLVLSLAALAVALWLGVRGAAVPAEQEALGLRGWGLLGLDAGRVLAAAAHALAVAGTAVAGRRLTHSGLAGLLAAALVAVDPAGLLLGSLAVPHAVAVAGLVWALAFTLSPIPLLHWFSGLALAVAVLALPSAALWIVPLGFLLLLRGHIYAAPQHLGLALAQVALVPVLALLARGLAEGDLWSMPDCLSPSLGAALLLQELRMPGPGLLVVPNPVTWLAGAGTVLFLGLGGVAFTLARFRLARAPGRLQVRVVSPFPPVLARGLWLMLLVLLAPPVAWLPLLALALALGIRELGDDAPGFGVMLAVVVLGFTAVVLWRAWMAVAGDAGGVADALDLVPWAEAIPCTDA
jgi:hypothetical protein